MKTYSRLRREATLLRRVAGGDAVRTAPHRDRHRFVGNFLASDVAPRRVGWESGALQDKGVGRLRRSASC